MKRLSRIAALAAVVPCLAWAGSSAGPSRSRDLPVWSGSLPATHVRFEANARPSGDQSVLERRRDVSFADLVARRIPDLPDEFLSRLERSLRRPGKELGEASALLDSAISTEHGSMSTKNRFLEDILAALATSETLPVSANRLQGPMARGVIDSSDVAMLKAFGAAPPTRREWPSTPFRLHLDSAATGTPVIEATIGDRAVHLWLDTGASGSVLSDEAARRCDIHVLGRSQRSSGGASGHDFTVAPAVVPCFTIGPAHLVNERVAVIPAAALTLGGESVDGILGWPVLRERRLELDFGRGCVTIGPPRSGVARPNLYWLGYPLVILAAEGRPAVFGLDTGAGSTRLSGTGLDLATGRRWATGFAVGGVGGAREVRSVMAERMTLGTASGTLTITHPKTAPGAFGALVPVEGRLGMDVLRAAGGAIIDYEAGELVLGTPESSTGASGS
jgi:predicted aspartyl protease